MTNEELTAIRKRAENSIGRGPDWDDFETLLREVERLQGIEAAALAQSEDVQANWLSPIEAAGLRAEVERLRAALERVSKIYPTPYVRQICEEALKGEQP